MPNDKPETFGLVIGYLPDDQLPEALRGSPSCSRCAVLLSSEHAGQVDADVDGPLYLALVGLAFRVATADMARVLLEDGTIQDAGDVSELERLFVAQKTREPFTVAAFFLRGDLRAALISEPYALIGGIAPYHDTYTQSFYARSELIDRFVQDLRATFAQRIGESFEGSSSPARSERGVVDLLRGLGGQAGRHRAKARRDRDIAAVLSVPPADGRKE